MRFQQKTTTYFVKRQLLAQNLLEQMAKVTRSVFLVNYPTGGNDWESRIDFMCITNADANSNREPGRTEEVQ